MLVRFIVWKSLCLRLFSPIPCVPACDPWPAAQPLTAEQQAYQAFYQLNRLGVQTRLGCFQVAGYQIAVQLATRAAARHADRAARLLRPYGLRIGI